MPNDPIEQKVWSAMKARIVASQGAGNRLEYVATASLYEGIRDNIPSGAFPAIILEPDGVEEANHSAPNRVLITIRTNITCVIEHMDLDKQIIGDGTTRGIVDIANDVKNALLGVDLATPDPKLGLASDGVLRLRFPSTDYFVDNYPMREAVITAEVEATTTLTGR